MFTQDEIRNAAPRYGAFGTSVGLLLAVLAGCGRAPAPRPAVLSTVRQIRELTPAELRDGIPAHIQGILTYFDGHSSQCFVQDATGGVRVVLAEGQVPPAVGWSIEISGTASAAGPAPAIIEARLKPLGAAQMPSPEIISSSRLRDPKLEYKLVSVPGVVQSVRSDRAGMVNVEIRSGQTTVWANIPASIMVVNEDWVDAEIRAAGVLAEPLDASSQGWPELWISDLAAIETVHLPMELENLPVTPITSLLSLRAPARPAHRVRVRGSPIPLKGGLAVRDAAAEIPVRAAVPPDPASHSLDLAGFMVWQDGQPVLDRAVPVAAAHTARGSQPRGELLTTAAQIHQLPLGAAQLAYPVSLHAVVTFFDPNNHLLFVQDETDGIFVELHPSQAAPLQPGDAVEVSGVTTADFAPDVTKARVHVVGHPGLPPAKRVSFGPANWGRHDCQYVELRGIVRRVDQKWADTLLTLNWGKGMYKAHVLATPDRLAGLVDAEVTVRGVCGALFNGKRQLLGIQVFLPGIDSIEVARQPPPDPFAVPPVDIVDLMRFTRAREAGHRVRIHGTVTYSRLSGPTWVRDDTGGLVIEDHEALALGIGDRVDVVGFTDIAGFSPVLRSALVRRLGSGPPPPAIRITAAAALKGGFDGQLVAIDGTLVDQTQQPAEPVLTVSDGEALFTAHLPSGSLSRSLAPGSHLRLTGICSVDTEQTHDLILPRAFRLRLRSPADIAVIGHPPLLTAGRVVPALAAAVLLICAVLAWVGLLRRRVRSQTFALRAQTVQLQAAHERTREALRKACEAESLDLDSKRILELIARDERVDLIIEQLAEAVALHSDGAVCAILLAHPYGPRVCSVPTLPPDWTDALGCLHVTAIPTGPELRAPRDFAYDPVWADFMASHVSRFDSVCAASIVVDGAAAGVIALFLRGDGNGSPHPQLDLWCNVATLALERRRLHDQLSYRAQHDGLTGLPNRAALYDKMEAEIARAAHGGGLLGVLYLDLDGFKEVNDTYGHDAGDGVLRETARRMSAAVRRGDTVARIGGDEFVVLLPMLNRREDAEQIATQLSVVLREPLYFEQCRLSVTASVGIAIWRLDGERPDDLLRFADSRMYGEKRSRRWYDQPSTTEPPASASPRGRLARPAAEEPAKIS